MPEQIVDADGDSTFFDNLGSVVFEDDLGNFTLESTGVVEVQMPLMLVMRLMLHA